MKEIFDVWKNYLNESKQKKYTRESLLAAKETIKGYMNCKIFAQEVTCNPKFTKAVPKVKYHKGTKAEPGDVFMWGDGSHYAVSLGGDEVIEVEGWGEEPRTNSLKALIDELDPPTFLFKTSEGQVDDEKQTLKESKGYYEIDPQDPPSIREVLRKWSVDGQKAYDE